MKLALNYREIEGKSTGFWVLLGGLGLLIALALGATLHMEHCGHHVTGMSNQIADHVLRRAGKAERSETEVVRILGAYPKAPEH